VELAARGIEGSLLIFAAVIEQRFAVLDHLAKNQLHGLLSQRRIAVKIADELPTQCPHVIDMSLDRLRRQVMLPGVRGWGRTGPVTVRRAADLFPAPSTNVASRSDSGNSAQGRDAPRWRRGLFW